MLFMHISNPFLLQIKCPLGFHFLNPNKASEMAQILEDIQTKYVPTHNGNEIDAEIIQRIFFLWRPAHRRAGKELPVGKHPSRDCGGQVRRHHSSIC